MGLGHGVIRDHRQADLQTGALVYYEIEERHFRGDKVNVINSMTVFEFDANDRIRRLNVYLQQAR